VSIFFQLKKKALFVAMHSFFVQSQSYGGIKQGIGVELAQTQDDTSCNTVKGGLG
jgi:hypothetical protein